MVQLGAFSTRVFVSDTLGNMRRLLPDPSVALDEKSPVYSPDGEWVFLSLDIEGGQSGKIWRVRRDGSDPERIGPATPAYSTDAHPSPSPDGSRLVFQGGAWEEQRLVVLDIASRDTTQLNVSGVYPKWSPRGDWILYWWANTIFRIRPDGTGNHQIGRIGGDYSDHLAWSPDGQWIGAREGAYVEYFNVDTNVRVKVPSTLPWGDVSWRPTPR